MVNAAKFSLSAFISWIISLQVVYADIIFVTQAPHPSLDGAADLGIVGCFHQTDSNRSAAPRGGDLYIRYDDGTLKNLTQAAGYGNSDPNSVGAIAVSNPAMHWDGNKAIFSMVISTNPPAKENWQLYEVTNFGKLETPIITKVPNQPSYNNIMPAYGSDDSIFFISDRPRNCANHLYPSLAQSIYKAAVNTGLWKLNVAANTLQYIDHQPSGSFYPFVDSFGRVIQSHWDLHMRDEDPARFNARDYPDEKPTSIAASYGSEAFHSLETIDHLFPWQSNQDGSGLVTLNHLGRHEVSPISLPIEIISDQSLSSQIPVQANVANQTRVRGITQISEDPLTPGRYYAVAPNTFQSHCAGSIISFSAQPETPANAIQISMLTDPLSMNYYIFNPPPGLGRYLNPVRLSNGALIASHTPNTTLDDATITDSLFDFRLTELNPTTAYHTAGQYLTSGIYKSSVSSRALWELYPVEVRARPRPPFTKEGNLESPEQSLFDQNGVDSSEFRKFLRDRNLALIVSRNVTARDGADRTQPFNLKVAGATGVQTTATAGPIHELEFLEVLQADSIREYFLSGRRSTAVRLHDAKEFNQSSSAGSGMFQIAQDGSVAAIVPAKRALTWRTTKGEAAGFQPVVRELYWLTFQPGEIRVCGSCHGVNETDQIGRPAPTNQPQALSALLQHYRDVLKPQAMPATLVAPEVCPTPPNSSNDNPKNDSAEIKLLKGIKKLLKIASQNPAAKKSTLAKAKKIAANQNKVISSLNVLISKLSSDKNIVGYNYFTSSNLKLALSSAKIGASKKYGWSKRSAEWKKVSSLVDKMLS